MIRYAVLICGLVACKAHEEAKKLGETCKVDRDCESGLDCLAGLEPNTKACMKPCGATRAEQAAGRANEVDSSCPAGWHCSGLSTGTLVDPSTGSQRAAFGGFADRPVCVPDGWTPK